MRTPRTITAAEAQLLEHHVIPRSEVCAVFKVDPAHVFLEKAQEFLAPHTARFDALLAIVAAEHKLSLNDITSAAKTRRVMAAKREAILLAVEFFSLPFGPEALGTWFNLSRSAMFRLLADARQQAKDDSAFAAHLDNLRPRIREALKSNPLPENSPHG